VYNGTSVLMVVLIVSFAVPPVVIDRVSAADEYSPVLVSLVKLYAGADAVPSKAYIGKVVAKEVVLIVSFTVPPVVIAIVSGADEYNPVFVSFVNV
jgi:hypothetical protein